MRKNQLRSGSLLRCNAAIESVLTMKRHDEIGGRISGNGLPVGPFLELSMKAQ